MEIATKGRAFAGSSDHTKPYWAGKKLPYSEANLELAKAEAHNGEYEIYDDVEPEPTPAPAGDDSVVWDELDAAYQEGVDSV